MVKGIFIGILIGAVIWQGVTAIADCFGGGEVSEKVGCGIFYLGYAGIKRLIELIGK